MGELEQAIDAIDHGLLPFTKSGEPPGQKIELNEWWSWW